MTEISHLRRRMIEDMTVCNLSPATQRSYVHAVAKFDRFFGRSPRRRRRTWCALWCQFASNRDPSGYASLGLSSRPDVRLR